ncbi:MAG: hypothetical protein M3Q30_10630 [Actinomycetota bacterium]|nr:hypothetical protein [Actinomycetota bacterium]
MVRMLARLVILGLAAYGAKRLYDDYFGSSDEADSAGRAIGDRVGRASERVSEHAHDAASDVATHARAASQEIRDAATDVVELSQPGVADDEQPQPQDR